MEIRGDRLVGAKITKQAIARRSCDQCRARKIRCDRGRGAEAPCSPCGLAKLSCTHSAVANSPVSSRQRVLISTEYERKIDEIAKNVEDIKQLLQSRNTNSPDHSKESTSSTIATVLTDSEDYQPTPRSIEANWGPSHMLDFVKALVEDGRFRDTNTGAQGLITSLKSLVQTLEARTLHRTARWTEAENESSSQCDPPPLDAILTVIRWANENATYTRVEWISHFLPLKTFTEICRKVFFNLEGYSPTDLVITYAFLSHIFSEYVVVTKRLDYLHYGRLCRHLLKDALSKLPILLPASIEAVAALALGAFHSIENSEGPKAWLFISAASNLAQTLGLNQTPSEAARTRLFWTIYKFEKGLSLRFSRPSSIRDSEITLSITKENTSRSQRMAWIQGIVFDQLYSVSGLARPVEDRRSTAAMLANALQEIMEEARAEIQTTIQSATANPDGDPLRLLYLQCNYVCESSLLAMILRATSTVHTSCNETPDDCTVAAREALDAHHECLLTVRAREKSDPYMIQRYVNWIVIHSPFIPFSILFVRAIRLLDFTELERLERFTSSLQGGQMANDDAAHSHRLYELLCQAARLHLTSRKSPSTLPLEIAGQQWLNDIDNLVDLSPKMNMDDFDLSAGEWYYGTQQIMDLLDENAMF